MSWYKQCLENNKTQKIEQALKGVFVEILSSPEFLLTQQKVEDKDIVLQQKLVAERLALGWTNAYP